MRHVCIFLSLFVLLIGEARAAGKRVALLIGNQDYVLDKLDLKNPHNDIAHVAAALKKVGFDVTLVKDAGLGKLQRELRRYTGKLRRAGSSAMRWMTIRRHSVSWRQIFFYSHVLLRTLPHQAGFGRRWTAREVDVWCI